MFENTAITLADLCTDVSYGYTASANEQRVGPKFLRITDIQGGEVEWDDVPYCEIDEKNLSKNKLKEGDIVVARTGNSTGENYLFSSKEEAVFASYLIRFRINTELANPYFVWLQMRTQNWWNYVAGSKSGSAQAGANAKVLGQFEIYLPERKIQDEIAEIVLGINQKLVLNRQINQTLEQIAQAIFKSWFVDFEPTRAKVAAKQNGQDLERAAMAAISGKTLDELDQLSPEQQAQLKTTAALFPDTLVDSELGEIPVGWGVQTLDSVLELAYGKALKKDDRVDGDFPVYGSGGLTGRHNKFIVEGPGVIVGRKGTIGTLYWEDTSFFPIDTVFYVKCKAGYSLAYSYYLLQTLGLDDMNTDAAVPGLNRNNVYRLEIVKAPFSLIDTFTNIVNTIRTKLLAQKQESNLLIEIRDSLLPKLLSSELSVEPNQMELEQA